MLPDARCNYIKFSDRERVSHRIRYMCRRPIKDLNENLEVGDLESFDREFAEFLLDYTPQRRNYGFLTNLKRFGVESGGKIPPKCPICNGELYLVTRRWGENLPEVPHLAQDRSGNWFEVDPPPEMVG